MWPFKKKSQSVITRNEQFEKQQIKYEDEMVNDPKNPFYQSIIDATESKEIIWCEYSRGAGSGVYIGYWPQKNMRLKLTDSYHDYSTHGDICMIVSENDGDYYYIHGPKRIEPSGKCRGYLGNSWCGRVDCVKNRMYRAIRKASNE